MSDREKALAALQLASTTCAASLTALLEEKDRSFTHGENADAPLETLLTDYTSLLSLVYQNATKLSLALKPSSPTYLASLTPLKEMTVQADALASCTCSVRPERHGKTLVKELRWSAEEVLGSIQTLLGLFVVDARNPGTGGADTYLVKTGTVHEAIDRAKGISRTNREAVRKRWEGDLGGLEDCLKEVQEMVDEDDGDGGSGDEGGSDDLDDDLGWGDLGIEPSPRKDSVKATKEEIVRLKSSHHLLKFTQAMQKRIASVLLAPSSPVCSPTLNILDGLLESSNALLAASDELVNALYFPQDPNNIHVRLLAFKSIIEDLHRVLSSQSLASSVVGTQTVVDRELVQKVEAMSIQPNCFESKAAKERKWFDACFAQIGKSFEALGVSADSSR